MRHEEIQDAIAARAGGEEFPGIGAAGLDGALAGSPEGLADLEALTACVGLLRAAVPAASATRRARTVTSWGRVPARRWIAAAALLVAAVIGVARMPRREVPPQGETLASAGRGLSGPTVVELLADLPPPRPRDPGGIMPPAGEEIRGGRGPIGGFLAPVAQQVSFAALVPLDTPALKVARASVVRPGPQGPPADVLWIQLTGRGDLVLAQGPAGPEMRAWLEGLEFPALWRKRFLERDGVLLLAVHREVPAENLDKVLKGLVRLEK